MKKAKKTPAWRALLTLLLSAILPACGESPTYPTYHAAEIGYSEAETEEQRAAAVRALQRFEVQHQKALDYFRNRELCTKHINEFIWYCAADELYNGRPLMSIDDTIRVWRQDHHVCGCARRRDVFGVR